MAEELKEYTFIGVEKYGVTYTVIAENEDEARRLITAGRPHVRQAQSKPTLDQESLRLTNVMEPALKPCPFCGGKPNVFEDDDSACDIVKAPTRFFTVQCGNKNCPVEVQVYGDTLSEAAKFWNTRNE